MKRLVLQNALAPHLLIYGGLALIMWPTLFRALGILNAGNDASPVFLYAGLSVMFAGGALRVYQDQQGVESFFKSYLFRVLAGIAVAIIMMLTGIIKTPAFLQHLF